MKLSLKISMMKAAAAAAAVGAVAIFHSSIEKYTCTFPSIVADAAAVKRDCVKLLQERTIKQTTSCGVLCVGHAQ